MPLSVSLILSTYKVVSHTVHCVTIFCVYRYLYICVYIHWRRQWHPTPVLLPGKIPWMEEPGRLQSKGSRRVGHNWATSLSLFTFMHWRRKWQPTPVFLPGESQGQEPGGLPSMGLHRVGYNWRDLAAAAVHMLPLAIHQSHFKCSYEYWLQNQAFAWG